MARPPAILAQLASLTLLAFLVAPGCTVAPADGCAEIRCSSARAPGPVHGVRANGRIDVAAVEAWPDSLPPPAPLTVAELAQACVILGSCLASTSDAAVLVGLCTLPDGSEERAIPMNDHAERRSWQLRRALAAPGGCTKANALSMTRPGEIVCEEDGCWWTSPTLPIPTVTCAGDVATLTSGGRTFTRDCSHAWQACDPHSPTGCTDRHPVACDTRARDRCDGAIKLGCDGTGRVSFHDCSRVSGGRCVERADGTAACDYPSAGACAPGSASTCTSTGSVTVCVAGAPVTVDCASNGFAGCAGGLCVK